MEIKLTDDFLEDYRVLDNNDESNYYRLPFVIVCDGEEYSTLRIYYEANKDRYYYALCYDDGYCVDEYYLEPSDAKLGYYELDTFSYRKDFIWD